MATSSKLRFWLIAAATLAAASAGAIAVWYGIGNAHPGEELRPTTARPKIFLHNHGQTSEVGANPADFGALLATCEEALTSVESGKMLQLIVFSKNIIDIEHNGLSVEVKYPSQRSFTLKNLPEKNPLHVLRINSILIELYRGTPPPSPQERTVTVFYGNTSAQNPYTYDNGPFGNSGIFDERLRAQLRKVGYQF